MESGTRIEAETLVRKATAIIQMKNVDSLVQFSGRGGYDKCLSLEDILKKVRLLQVVRSTKKSMMTPEFLLKR